MTIANRGSAAVGMTGWTLRDGSSLNRYGFPKGARLAPNESMTVTSADPGWSPGGVAVWNNTGDIALLLDERGRVVSRRRH